MYLNPDWLKDWNSGCEFALYFTCPFFLSIECLRFATILRHRNPINETPVIIWFMSFQRKYCWKMGQKALLLVILAPQFWSWYNYSSSKYLKVLQSLHYDLRAQLTGGNSTVAGLSGCRTARGVIWCMIICNIWNSEWCRRSLHLLLESKFNEAHGNS